VAEAQDLIDQRIQVTSAFITDWKKLSQATNNYANQLDQAFLQGNKSAYADVDRGVQAKTPVEVLADCNKKFSQRVNASEDKLRELDEFAGAPAE